MGIMDSEQGGSTQRRYDDVAVVGGKLSTWYYVMCVLHNRICRKSCAAIS